MSKSVASESNEDHKSREMSGKRGAGDEGKEDGDGIPEASSAANSTTLTTVSTVPAQVDDFTHTIEFKKLFNPFVHEQTLIALLVLNKEWNGVADVLIDEGVKSGELLVHVGNDLYWGEIQQTRRRLVTRVNFALDISQVGEYSCWVASNLVVVDIPEGIESIRQEAFCHCSSLTTVSFPTTLTVIGDYAFGKCSSLENVDLLHTNLQELGRGAFKNCSELKSTTILDSLQKLGSNLFQECCKLAPSNIDISGYPKPDATSKVVAHLRSKQQS
ncbi:hypothetical protein TL16_g07380 [Triparma laevis f. inornata]|uniref:Uncharacterized protein n=2 Tax=Triparma laevis TaxID=1534972 RepID=A0A9W7CJ38_9STRA|nr:hypothetical protein TL16_g07380 [Triparma laevis f. inornata]GMI05579.1 hypothetical protein TrLO_g11660 [Triparma laevis f. longispina]